MPNKLITGNDTQFTSTIFQEFCSTYGFVHVTTSPYYPQANGFSERTVQTVSVKNLLEKCKESGADPHLVMLCLRSTPLDHNIPSPAELVNSRVYQTNLPAMSKPTLSVSLDGDINTKLQTWQDQHKSQYDKSSKPLPVIHPDDPVHVHNPHSHKWEPGIVQSSTQAPRSYLVTMANGSALRQNHSYIRPTGEKICIQDNSSNDELLMLLNAMPSTPPSEDTPINTQTALGSEAPSNAPQNGCPVQEAPLCRSSRVVKPPDRLEL